jgi:hypothetical protein
VPDITATRPASGGNIDDAWGQQVHDHIEGIQAGSVNMTWSANAVATPVVVTFPRAYTSPPIVVATCSGGSGSVNNNIGVNSVTTTQVTLGGREVRETAQSVTVPVFWMAIGTPA